MSNINLYISSQQKAVFQSIASSCWFALAKNSLQAFGMLKGKHSIPSNSKIKKEQYLIILAQLRFMLVLVFHTFQPITWCGKFSLFPSERLAFAAYMVLMWIENLALHIADKATKAWEIFSPVQKIIQIHCRWFTLSRVFCSLTTMQICTTF